MLKDYLESLEIGEGKVKLSKEEIKSILAENGKVINTEVDKAKKDLSTEIDTYKTTINDLEEKIKKLPKSDELETLKTELEALKKSKEEDEANRKNKEEDEILTKNIKSAFGEKKFVNSFTENAIINEVKTALKDSNNLGKSAKDLFEELTKDKEDLFASENSFIDMGGDKPIDKNLSKETHDRELIGLPIEDKK